MKKAVSALLALGLSALLVSCDGKPISLRTDEKPISLNIGGDRYAIPVNYLAALTRVKDRSRGADGALVVASWPEMDGRPNDGKGYKHYTESNIRILIGSAGSYELHLRGIEATYESHSTKPRVGGMEGFTSPLAVGDAYGFEHLVRQHTPREKFHPSDSTHTDMFIRHNPEGRIEAYIQCHGEPAPQGKNPQCELMAAYKEFPGTSFTISFDRSEALHEVNKIERAVRAKFAEFKTAAVKAQAEGTFE